MADYALIETGVVVNVIVADEEFAADYVASDNSFTDYACIDGLVPSPGIGWTRDEIGVFSPPPLPAPSQEQLDRAEAQRLFTKSPRTPAETARLLTLLASLADVTSS